ncbi:hypothetical protein Lalb_Chr05g0221911 [Lupinus albus]|uniref:Uncharacterized protein n=1 Tax=Lupinus albus TaxID=3870 RepID=A0A6A4QJF4_LUPAL|nr:hypothetical protein Lalb_Chr05g0221911 [Lupinus albus]
MPPFMFYLPQIQIMFYWSRKDQQYPYSLVLHLNLINLPTYHLIFFFFVHRG